MNWLELPPHSSTAYEATLEHTGIILYVYKSANGWHYRINLSEQVRYISPVYSQSDEAKHHAVRKVKRLLEQDLASLEVAKGVNHE